MKKTDERRESRDGEGESDGQISVWRMIGGSDGRELGSVSAHC